MKDVLLITWHGIHELEIFPGLPDTGGQNVYVENMAEKIHDLYQCRVIILNRGGFTHPYTERMREGYSKDPERELYVLHIKDDVPAFLRKEYLTGALIEQASEVVHQQLFEGYRPDVIISHFWDGGLMAEFIRKEFSDVPHVWIPHEPVYMKKMPLPDSHHERHGILQRERYEERLMETADLVGSTSIKVHENLHVAYSGQYDDKIIDVFPGVDVERFFPLEHPRTLSGQKVRDHAEFLNLPESAFKVPHICEFGRSDALKNKDRAVEAFAHIAKEVKNLSMFLNLDQDMEPEIAARIHQIITDADLQDRVHVLSPHQLPQSGHGSDIMPNLLKTAKVFITMSVMEGFGMAACEAAACGVPVVGTRQIPVVTDHIEPAGGGQAVDAYHIEEAANAVCSYLAMNQPDYEAVCDRAYESVIPKFTWRSIVAGMFEQMQEKGISI